MITKEASITIPKEVKKDNYLDYAADQLKEDLKIGWKIGGIVYSKTEDKKVILFI